MYSLGREGGVKSPILEEIKPEKEFISGRHLSFKPVL